METLNINKRIYWVDQLKAFGMFLVILGHCILKCETLFAVKLIYSFHMALFFILSGFTLRLNKYNNLAVYIKHKFKSTIYPYLAISFILLPLWYYNSSVGIIQDDAVLEIIIGIFYSNSAVVRATTNAGWFLVTLFFAEIIFYVIHKYFGKCERNLFLVSLSLLLIGVISSIGTDEIIDAPFHLNVSLVASFYICIGYLIKLNFNTFNFIYASFGKYKLAIIALFISSFFAIINKTIDFSNEVYGDLLYTLISSIGISLTLIYLFQFLPKIKILCYIGKNSLIYLLVHVPLLRTIQHFFPFIIHSRMYSTFTALFLYAFILIIVFVINRFFPFLIRYKQKRLIKL